jgi:hypothetical protein
VTAPLIGLVGYARSGKNTVAELLGAQWAQVAFADPLREAVYEANPVVWPAGDTLTPPVFSSFHEGAVISRYRDAIDELGYEIAKDSYPEVRGALQGTGKAIRALDPEFWLRMGMQRVDDQRTRGPVVVTDVRYPNEADAIRERGGLIVRVYRTGTAPGPNAHESETALDDYEEDLAIENHYSLEALADRVADVDRLVRAVHELRQR